MTLGMPEDKATIYETRLKAGEFLMMVEVPSERSGEFQLLLESAQGEEINTTDQPLPRACAGRCNRSEDLSPEIRSHLSEEAQKSFIERYNTVVDETNDEFKAEQAAWETIHQEYEEDENGIWSKSKKIAVQCFCSVFSINSPLESKITRGVFKLLYLLTKRCLVRNQYKYDKPF